MFDNIKKMLRMSDSKKKAVAQTYATGTRAISGSWDFQKGLSYDNTYPSVSRIADSFADIRPYAIDANGKPVQNANALNCLYRPNQRQSAVMFRYALATSVLTHRKTYLLAYHREGDTAVAGGDIREGNLAGFSFIQGAIIRVDSKGHKTYQINGDSRTYSEYEVLEITTGSDPYDIDAGYAPSVAIRKWSDIDDFVANHEAGFFENGAVPAGEFIITAKSVADFEDIVKKLQSQHRGSGNNNNVVYTHRPISPDTGAPLNAQIEWIPFAQTNQQLDLTGIFNQVNNKVDSAFGVPASIRGVSLNNGYASAKVDERTFTRFVLKPFATKLWDCFTHELNRITGGLGYAITFDLDIPAVADEEKVEAERKLTELNLIITAQNAGFTLDSIITAFDLSNGYKTLKMGESSDTEIKNDKPEVDEGNETYEAPEHAVEKTAKREERSPDCPKGCSHDHGIVAHKSADRTTIQKLRKTLKETYDSQIQKAIGTLDQTLENEDLLETLASFQDGAELTEHELKAIYAQLGLPEPEEDETNALMLALLAILYERMQESGDKKFTEVVEQFKLQDQIPADVRHYEISDQAQDTYNQIASGIAGNWTRDNASAINETTAKTLISTAAAIIQAESEAQRAELKRIAKEQTAKNLKKLPNEEKYRFDRIANTEEHRADNLGQIDAIQNIESMTTIEFRLRWKTTSGNPCDFCRKMENTTIKAGEAFVPLGGTIEADDGSVLVNDYVPMTTPNAHPNCQCIYELVSVTKEQGATA